jgi:hypothetical protein
MTSTTGNNGRLGNQIIRNLAVSLIAKKFDLYVNYHNNELINKLGIELFSGKQTYDTVHHLNDDNYFTVYMGDKINYNLNPNEAYFQTKEITNLLHEYLHTDIIKSIIIEKNPFNNRYNNNNDLFIHIRLTDTSHFNPGLNYYVNTIKNINFDSLYISTDEPNHPIVHSIIKLYPTCNLIIHYDEITTIQFSSTCKNIILSHGSFSAVIGYLSFFSKIYYPEYEKDKIWYGNMFSIKDWIKCNIN